MHWTGHSIMARRSVARGQPGQQHSVTGASQGCRHHGYGPCAVPVLTVGSGAIISAETHDAFEQADACLLPMQCGQVRPGDMMHLKYSLGLSLLTSNAGEAS